MDIPDELTFKILEDVAEEHEYNDEMLWCDGPFYDDRWTLTKRVTDGTEENVAQVSDNRGLHQEQIVRSTKNKLVSRALVESTGNTLNGTSLGRHADLQALVCAGRRTDVPNDHCQEKGFTSRAFGYFGQ